LKTNKINTNVHHPMQWPLAMSIGYMCYRHCHHRSSSHHRQPQQLGVYNMTLAGWPQFSLTFSSTTQYVCHAVLMRVSYSCYLQ